jgi:hypothetical protein
MRAGTTTNKTPTPERGPIAACHNSLLPQFE